MSVINQVLQDLDRRQGGWNLVPEGVMVGAQAEMAPHVPTGALHAAAFDTAALPVARDSVAAPTWSERLHKRWNRLHAEPTQRLHLALVASAVVAGASLAGAGLSRHSAEPAPEVLTATPPAPRLAAASPTPITATPANATTAAVPAAAASAAQLPPPSPPVQPAPLAAAAPMAPRTDTQAPATAADRLGPTAVATALPAPTLARAASHPMAVKASAGKAAASAVLLARGKSATKPAPSTVQAQAQVAAASGALALAASAQAQRPAASAPALQAAATSPGARLNSHSDGGSIDKRERQQAPRERADAEHQRGLALQQQGQASEASAAFAAALRADKTHVAARQALALALFQQHQTAEAEALLAEGLALQPQQASLAMLLSRFKLDHQDLSGAIEVLKNALPSEGGSAEARGLLAAQLQRANQHVEAAEQFALALRQNPSHGVWWMGLGISLAADGRNAAAREAFQRARYASGLSAELQAYVEQRLKGL